MEWCQGYSYKPEELLEARRSVLVRLGGSPEAIARVIEYGRNHFTLRNLPSPPVLPMPDEAHVAYWKTLPQDSADLFTELQRRLPQFAIPLRDGISKTQAYEAVIQRGEPFDEKKFEGRLLLNDARRLRLVVHEHAAGALPVLITSNRDDFETLVRALIFHHEPGPTNHSVNAQMISGFLNWERVRAYQAEWITRRGFASITKWPQEKQRVAAGEKWRFYDRLMLVCEHPYSSLTAGELGLQMNEEQWLQTSTVLRLEHEFTHYATYRLYGYMALNLLDETICDWAGMTLALGRFDARCLLHFLGLENPARVRPNGRIHAYCSELDQNAFDLACKLMRQAAEGLEDLTTTYSAKLDRTLFLLALTRMTLELMAARFRHTFFRESCREAAQLLCV